MQFFSIKIFNLKPRAKQADATQSRRKRGLGAKLPAAERFL